jgi:hypothetical protein
LEKGSRKCKYERKTASDWRFKVKKKKILQPAQSSLRVWIMAARKRKEQIGTS